MTFEVWPNGCAPEDGMTIPHARDHEDAAAQYGERSDCESADYTIVGGTPEVVSVRALNSGEVQIFAVSGETVNHYSARKLGSLPA